MKSKGPFLVDPHPPESEGVDYLGLRAINLSMMDMMLPGINNVVDMIRPFSLMAWIAWRFEEGVKGRAVVSTDDFRRFQQKVETVFAFSHVNANDAEGLPGRQQKPPTGNVLRFQFADFKRSGSILDAALYGPALKNLSGLGFLAGADNFIKVTSSGRKLALSLDTLLREHLSQEQYGFISSIDSVEARRELIDEQFYKAWSISQVSALEKQAFSERLFQQESIGELHPHARRAAVLLYIVETLRGLGEPTTPRQLRVTMARTFPKALLGHEQVLTFQRVQRHWQLLQVRQAQRLALEAMFGWVERCLTQVQATSVDDLVDLAIKALDVEVSGPEALKYVQVESARLRGLEGGIDALFAWGANEPDCDVFYLCDTLEAAVKSFQPSNEILEVSFRLLLLCVRFADAFRNDAVTKNEVSAGARFRLPLGVWADFVKAHEQQSLTDVLHKILARFIISQHLGVAASRSSDEKSRMRMSIEDGGLASLLPNARKVLQPKRTPDRLASALSLMAECGLVQEIERAAKADGPAYVLA